MPKGQTASITKIRIQNSKTETTVSAQTIPTVMEGGVIKPDPEVVNPGVVLH